MVVVLVLAAGAGWESGALAALSSRSDVVVLKRCVDVADLLATAAAGQSDVAVVGLDAPGLDLAAVDHLRGHGVRVVAVVPGSGSEGASLAATRIGARTTLPEDRLAELGEVVTVVDEPDRPVVDEVSGVLSAARLVATGQLEERFAGVPRSLDHRLSVVTGLPRADRWPEVRDGVLEQLLEVARGHGHVVVDTGFCLEEDPGTAAVAGRPGRNAMTLAALGAADEVVVVGSADPVGLSRLARGLVELRELVAPASVRVLVNRMRPTLGWSERDIAAMLEGLVAPSRVHFLPEDRAGVDRALLAGRTLPEVGESALTRVLAAVVAQLVPGQAAKSR